ncbi:MAG: zinc ribbon domain-containing protein [Eggerthellaceae bacterium]
MNELLSQLWTPQLQSAFMVVVAMLVVLYVLSIVWVVRDAYQRGAVWYIWAIVALVPLVGVIAYCLLRPSLLQIDRDEQELEVALKQRELMKYGECATCGYPVENDYVLCPNCHQRLKNLCGTCGHALEPSWTVCPYCATPAGGARPQRAAGNRGQQRMQQGDAAAPRTQTSTTSPRKAASPNQARQAHTHPAKDAGQEAR